MSSSPTSGCLWCPTSAGCSLGGLVYPVGNFMSIIFKIYDKTAVIRNGMIIEKTSVVVLAFALYPLGVYAMIGAAIALSMLSLTLYVCFASRLMSIGKMRFVST